MAEIKHLNASLFFRRIFYGIFLLIATSQECFAQKNLKVEALNRYTLFKQDTIYQFYAVKPATKITYENDKKYYWYVRDTIIITQAAHDGKILHGTFKIFYPDKNLKEEGTFKNGLKKGEWKYWYPQGRLRQVINWKKGNENGKIKEFDELGNKTKKGKIKKQQFSGYVIKKLNDGKTIKEVYKKGQKINEDKS